MENKRRHRRKSFPVFVDYANGRGFYQRTITDISHSGLFIKTRNQLPVGQRLTLCFELQGKPFRIRAQVVRLDPLGMGVKFLSGSEDDRAMMRQLVGRI